MFAVDTQQHLQTYLDLAANLQPQSWVADIQSLYRAIHTIKGGAVTVGAEAMLSLATTLEDLLSDLRYLNVAPPLADGCLQEILLEGGELLAATLSPEDRGMGAPAVAAGPSQQRLLALRERVRADYLPNWDEQKQLHQDFAEQGFDLVTLDLEIALKQLPDSGPVPASECELAEQLLAQLAEIGQDLELAAGWSELLSRARDLLEQPECSVWQSQWPQYFAAFKESLRAGGDSVASPPAFDLERTAPLQVVGLPEDDTVGLPEDDDDADLTDAASFLDAFADEADDVDLDVGLEEFASEPTDLDLLEPDDAAGDVTNLEPPLQSWTIESPAPEPAELPAIAGTEPTPDRSAASTKDTRIPVPLERLERSAQTSVATVLSLRSVQGAYKELQNRLTQLVAIAQESSRYTARIRELQDDYASLDKLETLTLESGGKGPALERYRQGYTTINRLLETNLRLSELGAEAEKISQQTVEGLQRLDRDVLQLQTTIEDSRLVSFQNLAFRARATLRDLSVRYGKSAHLQITGERTELDVGVVRQLEAILLHLLRNAYDHGLESPADRVAAGKPAQGTIFITLQRQGNSYNLSVGDDGRGIDTEAIRARATALGLPLQEVGTAADLLAVLCQHGFSSRTQVSDISGRGVGLDVVADGVARLGGSIELQTKPNRGTTFALTIPVPHLLVPCVLLQAGDRTFAIPTEEIEATQIFENLTAAPVAVGGHSGIWEVADAAGTTAPALDLLAYWHPEQARRAFEGTAICAHVRQPSSPQGIWLFADELLGQADLPIATLPDPLLAPSGLLGTSLQGDGSLVPVLETASLARFLANISAARVTATSGGVVAAAEEDVAVDDRILIVDDAALMRRRLEASLTACGYDTHTCADGLEAWNWLQANPTPRLVISDIEMPGMDGFTLIDRCRQAGLAMPVLVVSSRLSEEWHREARRLGATDYLTKGFSTAELLEKVSMLLETAS